MTTTVFEILVTSSTLILGIFCLRKLTMGKISMRLRYGLWLLAAARLVMPLSLGTSPVSVMNLFPDEKPDTMYRNIDSQGTEETLKNPAQGIFGQTDITVSVTDRTQSGSEAASAALEEAETVYGKKYVWLQIIWNVWLLGVFLTGGCLLWMRFRFARYLRKNRKELPREKLPDFMAEKLARHGMRVYRVKGLPSPCLVGRHIYTGEKMPDTEQGLLHVLAHEYCHALHGDGFWAFLRCALTALWWFDPLVWAAAFAARQDSDLACDEAVVRLLGETERFAYGRTLLTLLQEGAGKAECPGMPLMFSGSARDAKERIVSLTEKRKEKAFASAAVLSMALLLCGCAFTGAQTQTDAAYDIENLQAFEEETKEEKDLRYAEYLEALKQTSKIGQATFAETLADYDDSGLSGDQKVDVQHFYEYGAGKREDAPEEGWYLLCRNEEEAISCYGLYTEGFGCRGVKTLIGEDVNDFDLVWYPCYMNEDSQNIRVLERAQDGLPRRFVWKYVEEESSVVETWRLAACFRYDTGTVDMKMLSQEDYLSWADRHLTFEVDQAKGQAQVYYDGTANASVGVLDISGYQDFEVEGVQICTDTVAFELDSKIYGENASEDFEGIVIHLIPSLKLKGHEGLWNNGLSPLAVELIWDEEEDGGFRFGQPKVDEQYVCRSLVQERELEDIR